MVDVEVAIEKYGGIYVCRCPSACYFKSDELIDANLNETGRSQVRNAGFKIRASKEAIELAITSPLRGTTETCILALGNHANNVDVIAIEVCRELPPINT